MGTAPNRFLDKLFTHLKHYSEPFSEQTRLDLLTYDLNLQPNVTIYCL